MTRLPGAPAETPAAAPAAAPARTILILHPSLEVRQWLARLATGWTVVEADGWRSLHALLQSAPALDLVIAHPYTGPGRTLEMGLAGLCRSHPETAVLALLDVSADCLDDLLTMGRWGVADVLDLGTGETDPLTRRLAAAEPARLERLLQEASALPEGRAGSVVLAAIDTVTLGRGDVADLAGRLGTSAAGLRKMLEAEGLPAARDLLRWIRVLRAARLLQDPARPVRDVALRTGYSSEDALRRAMRETLGIGPRLLRDADVWRTALGGFRCAVGAPPAILPG